MLQEKLAPTRRVGRTAAGVVCVVLVVCVGPTVLVTAALAAPPAPGGAYFGFGASLQDSPSLVDLTAKLSVSRSGGRLTSAQLRLRCTRPGGVFPKDVTLTLRRNPGAAVRRDGSFRLSVRAQGGRFRLAGRFVTPEYGRFFYRADVPPRRVAGGRRVCQGEGSPAVVYRDGQPPFSSCAGQRAQTLLVTDTGRVFQQELLQGKEFWPHVYACLFAQPSERVHLGQNWDEARLKTFRLAGPFVAYFSGGCAACVWDQWTIKVRDLRDGSPFTPPLDPSAPPPPQPLDGGAVLYDLVLTPHGSTAWTSERIPLDRGVPTGGPPLGREVWALDSQGYRVLDSGPDLRLESLELDGSTLTWTNGGTIRSATLD